MTSSLAVLLAPAVIRGSDVAAIVIALLVGAYLIYILLTSERL